jgi:hypothetical protein
MKHELVLEVDMRAALVALAVMKPVVFLRLLSAERAASIVVKLIRIRAR